MSTFELEPGGLRREYVVARRGKPEVWPEWNGDKIVWRCRNVAATEMATIMRGLQARKKARAESTPAERKARMAAKWTARMKAMAKRTPASSRDLSRERMAWPRGPVVLSDSCNGRIF